MTWLINLIKVTEEPVDGNFTMSVGDEVADEVRSAVLAIIARPVFEREEQTKRLFEMAVAAEQQAEEAIAEVRHEDWTEAAGPIEPQKPAKRATGRPRAKRGARRAWDVTRSDLLNIMVKARRPLTTADLSESVNARRVERGALRISTSTVRSTLIMLEREGQTKRQNEPGRGGQHAVWELASFTCTLDQDEGVIAGSAS